MKTIKISTLVEAAVWRELKGLSHETHQSLSGLLTDAVRDFVRKRRMRPSFLKAMEDSLTDNERLGRLLAK